MLTLLCRSRRLQCLSTRAAGSLAIGARRSLLRFQNLLKLRSQGGDLSVTQVLPAKCDVSKKLGYPAWRVTADSKPRCRAPLDARQVMQQLVLLLPARQGATQRGNLLFPWRWSAKILHVADRRGL